MQYAYYFVFVLLMCGMTGWLAFYAWQQHNLPGARAYSALALCECCLALTELLSMLSPGPGLALFWFNVRFLFTGTMAVLFLVFAVEYNGHRNWLSRRLIVFGFIIPVLTQVILWTNILPGLWVKQDVSFIQNGPFWVSDTSTRIPGLWFLVHSFYSLLLLLAGIGVIIVTAWRKPRLNRGQALLLTTGALIALITTLFPTFNLVPPGGFNPFIPGIGVSALFYALAIFRFQFLTQAFAAETPAQTTPSEFHENRSLALFLLIFLLFVAGICSIGYLTYKNYESQIRSQIDNQLSSIGALKITELQNWRNERLGDAETLHKNPVFSALVQRFLENPADSQTKTDVQTWLKIVDEDYQYDRVFLLDTNGIERISSSDNAGPVDVPLVQILTSVLSKGQVTFQDFHRDFTAGPIHLALLVPILTNQDHQPLGLLVLQIDPQVVLYPFIQKWPVPSASAETLLVRRDGEDVLFLNTLRFNPDAALNLREPLANTQVLSVKAVLGQTGIVDGIDYRGVPVIGDIQAVPGSPWFIVSRIDLSEVYGPLQDRLWETIVLLGALILAGGGGLALALRQQQIHYYRSQFEAAQALLVSEENYHLLFEQAADGIFIADMQGKYVDVNSSGCLMLGYTRDELLNLNLRDLVPADDQEKAPLKIDELEAGNKVMSQRQMRGKDGTLIDVEISGKMLPDGRMQGMVRNITQRKRDEKALRQKNEYLTALQETTLELLSQIAPETLFENIVRRAGLLMGTSSGYLDLVEHETGILKPKVGMGALAESLTHSVQLGEGVSGTVWQTRLPLVVNDYDHWTGRIAGYSAGVLASVVGVPLLFGSQVLGVLGLGYDFATQRTFEAGDVETLTQFARLAVIAIENARLFSSAQKELAERKHKESDLFAAQAELQDLLTKADRSRHALLSVIEDQKIAEEEIRRLNSQLEQRVADRTAQLVASNKELEAFAYSISHDLRAPLRAIDGFSRILQNEYAHKLDAEGLRLLGVVRDSTSNMDHLITDLLALSRLGRTELHYSPIDMTALVTTIYQELATPEVKEKFAFNVSDLPCASGDPTLIRQVWVNLISNAIKYSLPKESCRIAIDGWENDGLFTYSIKDNGVGFNPKYADKLFGLFQRLHKAKDFEGTGVGLAIVQRIIHRHGGQVWGEGQVNVGATFYFNLPERQADRA